MKRLLGLFIVIGLNSCGYIYHYEIDAANKFCKDKGGILRLNEDVGDVVCKCQNGETKRFNI